MQRMLAVLVEDIISLEGRQVLLLAQPIDERPAEPVVVKKTNGHGRCCYIPDAAQSRIIGGNEIREDRHEVEQEHCQPTYDSRSGFLEPLPNQAPLRRVVAEEPGLVSPSCRH